VGTRRTDLLVDAVAPHLARRPGHGASGRRYVSIPTLTDDGDIEASFAAAAARQVRRVFSTMSDVGCGRQLATIAGLITDGHVTLPPMQTLPLEQAAEAHVLIQTGHVRGKIVLNVAEF
jgi:NADPH2:quinone reductase